ncbi:MAG: hypothetical protein MK335_13595, partial [Gemmatimonadetes bacterium]|nr:hypothetical protein [Gemmatimonadota bacterium]
MNKGLLSGRCSLGIGLIFVSFLIAQIVKVTFFLYLTDATYRNGSIVLYVISWLLFVAGIWLVGREYYGSVKKYTTLKFYHESVAEGTRKVAAKILKKP